ncbi:hypothetical protein GCM10010466_09600 [Planomonospora alba]|uniref:Uncharacterized protein n=1 Tax=Planomonospora alba TaxID=161354 RepID=A0ABP6MR07_9ACTN
MAGRSAVVRRVRARGPAGREVRRGRGSDGGTGPAEPATLWDQRVRRRSTTLAVWSRKAPLSLPRLFSFAVGVCPSAKVA